MMTVKMLMVNDDDGDDDCDYDDDDEVFCSADTARTVLHADKALYFNM